MSDVATVADAGTLVLPFDAALNVAIVHTAQTLMPKGWQSVDHDNKDVYVPHHLSDVRAFALEHSYYRFWAPQRDTIFADNETEDALRAGLTWGLLHLEGDNVMPQEPATPVLVGQGLRKFLEEFHKLYGVRPEWDRAIIVHLAYEVVLSYLGPVHLAEYAKDHNLDASLRSVVNYELSMGKVPLDDPNLIERVFLGVTVAVGAMIADGVQHSITIRGDTPEEVHASAVAQGLSKEAADTIVQKATANGFFDGRVAGVPVAANPGPELKAEDGRRANATGSRSLN